MMMATALSSHSVLQTTVLIFWSESWYIFRAVVVAPLTLPLLPLGLSSAPSFRALCQPSVGASQQALPRRLFSLRLGILVTPVGGMPSR